MMSSSSLLSQVKRSCGWDKTALQAQTGATAAMRALGNPRQICF